MEITWNKDKNIVCIRLTGILDKEMILNAFDQAVSDHRYVSGMGRLWDFRDADLSSISSSTIRAMTRHPQKYPNGIGNVKVAFVTSRDLEYGLTNVFKFSSEAATPINLYRSIEEAEAWLSSREKEI